MKTETAKELLDMIIAGIGREEVLNLLNAQEKAAAAEPSREKEMEEFINSICARLTIKTLPEYPFSLFYMDGNTWMMEYDIKSGDIVVRYDKIWSVFSKRFGLDYKQTQAVMKTLLEKALKIEEMTPKAFNKGESSTYLEKALKTQEITPNPSKRGSCAPLEQAIKLKGTTKSN